MSARVLLPFLGWAVWLLASGLPAVAQESAGDLTEAIWLGTVRGRLETLPRPEVGALARYALAQIEAGKSPADLVSELDRRLKELDPLTSTSSWDQGLSELDKTLTGEWTRREEETFANLRDLYQRTEKTAASNVLEWISSELGVPAPEAVVSDLLGKTEVSPDLREALGPVLSAVASGAPLQVPDVERHLDGLLSAGLGRLEQEVDKIKVPIATLGTVPEGSRDELAELAASQRAEWEEMQAAFGILTEVSRRLGDPQLARMAGQVQTAATSILRMSQAIESYSAGAISSSAMTGNFISAALGIVGLFLPSGSSGPPPEILILEELQALRKSLEELGRRLEYRLEIVDEKLDRIWRDLDHHYQLLVELREEVSVVERALTGQAEHLNRFERDVARWFRELSEIEYARVKRKCLGYKRLYPADPMTFDMYAECSNNFLAYALDTSRTAVMATGFQFQDPAGAYSPGVRVLAQRAASLHRSLGADEAEVRHLEKAGREMSNPIVWAAGARAYAELLLQWPHLAQRSRSEESLGKLLAEGEELRKTLASLDNAGAFRTRSFYRTLLDEQGAHAKAFESAVQAQQEPFNRSLSLEESFWKPLITQQETWPAEIPHCALGRPMFTGIDMPPLRLPWKDLEGAIPSVLRVGFKEGVEISVCYRTGFVLPNSFAESPLAVVVRFSIAGDDLGLYRGRDQVYAFLLETRASFKSRQSRDLDLFKLEGSDVDAWDRAAEALQGEAGKALSTLIGLQPPRPCAEPAGLGAGYGVHCDGGEQDLRRQLARLPEEIGFSLPAYRRRWLSHLRAELDRGPEASPARAALDKAGALRDELQAFFVVGRPHMWAATPALRSLLLGPDGLLGDSLLHQLRCTTTPGLPTPDCRPPVERRVLVSLSEGKIAEALKERLQKMEDLLNEIELAPETQPLLEAVERELSTVRFELSLLRSVGRPDLATWWPLMWAARHGDAASIRALIDAGAKVDRTDEDGWTPLMLAAFYGNLEAVRALLAGGARRGLTNKAGQDAATLSALRGNWDLAALLAGT